MRGIIRTLIFTAGLMLFMTSQTKAAGFPPAPAHEVIASGRQWLNTSRPLEAEDLAGRIVLLDFWTYCCINCMQVIPDLKYLEEKYGGKLTVIGVHSAKFLNEKDTDNIRQATMRYGIEHPVVNDADFNIWQRFGVRAWPTLMLLTPEGRVKQVYSGEGHREALDAEIGGLVDTYQNRLRTDALPLLPEVSRRSRQFLHYPGKLTLAESFRGAPALFVADSGNHRIVVLRLSGEVIETIGAGSEGLRDGDFATAQFRRPQGMAYRNDKLYVADTDNHALRVVDFSARTVATLAGDGTRGTDRFLSAKAARGVALASPWDVAFYPDEKHLALAMAGTHQLWSYDIAQKTLSTLAGNGSESIEDGAFPANSLSQPSGLSAQSGKIFFVDSETSSLRVFDGRKITTLLGTGLFDFGFHDGAREKALMQHPLGLAATEEGVFIADSYNHAIRRYDPATAKLETVIGKGKKDVSEAARLNEPGDVEFYNGFLYVADTNHHRVIKIDTATSEARTLPIQEAEEEEKIPPAYGDNLPNLERMEAQRVATGQPASLSITLDAGWKINPDAPSYLALYRQEHGGWTPLLAFNTAQLSKEKIQLPDMDATASYRLQGSLYYCRSDAQDQCLLQSIDLPVQPVSGGATTISIILRAHSST